MPRRFSVHRSFTVNRWRTALAARALGCRSLAFWLWLATTSYVAPNTVMCGHNLECVYDGTGSRVSRVTANATLLAK